MKGLGIVVFWNFVVIFAFCNSHFIVVLDSAFRMSACFWLFGIQWLAYDCLWPRDLIDDSLILEALHHYKPILDRGRRTKCSAFKIRRQPITFLLLENEFWVQRHRYETNDLKNNLQTKIIDGEWKRSGFIWLHWIHISLFQQLSVESILSVAWQIVSISGEKLKARGKKNAFNKPS